MSYKVKKGDTLSGIAKAHNMSLDELLKLNGISKDKANSISVGQEIKIGQPSPSTETPEFRTPLMDTQYTIGMNWQPTSKPEDSEMGVPYAPGYTKKAFATDHAKTLQEQLVAAGYSVGKTGVDGKWGKNSQAALDKALAEGYTLKGNQLVKPTLKPRKTAATPQTASTGIDLKYLKSNALSIQQQLKESGYDLGTSGKNKDGVDGSWGDKSQTALSQALADGYSFKDGKLIAPKKVSAAAIGSVNPVLKKVGSDYARYLGNFFRSPRQAVTDAVLYVADIAGAPTNATNYLRDLNVSLPYRAKSAVKAGFKTIMGDRSWEENYNEALANPGLLTRATTIRPLVNTNYNFSDEELAVLRDMAGSDFHITNGDIKRVSENKRYGGIGALRGYFSPAKVIQTAIGQSSGNADEKLITDIFDVNTVGEVAEKDNAMYEKLAAKSSDFGYEDLRATMPYYNMIDIIPDQYKIHTRVRYEK